MVLVGMFIWPFVFAYESDFEDQTVWSFVRQFIAVIFLSFALIKVEVLLKLRKCIIHDVMFNVGWIGVVLTIIESLVYEIV